MTSSLTLSKFMLIYGNDRVPAQRTKAIKKFLCRIYLLQFSGEGDIP